MPCFLFQGVDKRKVLREILNMLLSDLQWQDFYIEFDEMLQLVENGPGLGENADSIAVSVPSSSGHSSKLTC